MAGLQRTTWLPRLLFGLTVAVALVLFALVLLAPLLDNREPTPNGMRRLAAVFARDVPLRRTAVAAAVGLLASACIFFRWRRGPRFTAGRNKPTRTPPPRSIAGA